MSKSKGAVQGAASTGIFSDPKYKSTNVQFRGQDKEKSRTLGGDPNMNVEEEYIGNLQQQVHFMELELKILKEKVVDDEKNSGIGSLFDDEKSSHQHIHLLKTKYAEMRRTFDLNQQELSRRKLDVIGQQLIFDSQIVTVTKQTDELYKEKKDYENTIEKELYNMEKTFKETSKAKNNLDSDVKGLDSTLKREM